MEFNPDLSKQAQEVIFSRKTAKLTHPTVFFNDVKVTSSSSQKHIGMYLDEKLNFNHCIKQKLSKALKGSGVIKKVSNILSQSSLLTI